LKRIWIEMASFKQIKDTQTVETKYSGRVIVYLESQEDFHIFQERWFYDEGEFLEFHSTDQGAGGGCSNVIKQVEIDRKNGIIAFGIVDRDAVMKHNLWDIFWETDDSKYKDAKPFGDHVRQLCRWEVENYLLDPEELENMLADVGKDAPRKKRPVEFMIKELLNHCNILIPIMAINVLLHKNGKPALTIKFGSDCLTGENMQQTIKSQIYNSFPDKPDEIKNEFNEYIRLFESFGENYQTDSAEYWDRLNRMIDGKRIFDRLGHQNKLRADYRFYLARRIREKKQIDQEIIDLIDYFKEK